MAPRLSGGRARRCCGLCDMSWVLRSLRMFIIGLLLVSNALRMHIACEAKLVEPKI